MHLFYNDYFFCLQLLAVNSQGKSKWSDVVLFSTHPERPGNDPETICQDLPRARWLFKSFLHQEAQQLLLHDVGPKLMFQEISEDLQAVDFETLKPHVNSIMSIIVLLMANIYCVIIVREFHLFTLIHIYLLACSFWIHLF